MAEFVGYVDESGSKQKAYTPPKSDFDIGVAAGIVVNQDNAERFVESLKTAINGAGVILQSDSHITDVDVTEGERQQQEKLRQIVFKTIQDFTPTPIIVFEAISAKGFHNAEYVMMRNLTANAKPTNDAIKISNRIENTSAHATMLANVVNKIRAAITDCAGDDDNFVKISLDTVDAPIVREVQQQIGDFENPSSVTEVRAYDTENKKVLTGKIVTKVVGLPSIADLPSYEIQTVKKGDYGVFAADVIANSMLFCISEYVKEHGVERINTREAIHKHQLAKLCYLADVSNGFDASDVIYGGATKCRV